MLIRMLDLPVVFSTLGSSFTVGLCHEAVSCATAQMTVVLCGHMSQTPVAT